ncbi:CGNR zinc finger domain-containing protein [Geodermatophilus sp. SYSU D01106]
MGGAAETMTSRYGLALAPGGLFVAQELVNTGVPRGAADDPLLEAGAAQDWLDTTMAEWSARTGQADPHLSLGDRDLPRLREFREVVDGWLRGQQSRASSTMSLGLTSDRGITYAPRGPGAAGLQAVVVLELLLASRTDALRRLKVCANPECGAAFHDESRNGSRRWHDVRTCGNTVNLRRARARKAAAPAGGAEGAREVD